MDNFQIADAFTLLSKLLDIHGENSFKSKSYASAAFAIEKLPIQLENISPEKLASLKGIGTSTAQKITEMLETGKIKALEEIIFITPKGILEMMQIKGLGPKKINAIWKEMGIETIGELWYACKENRLKLFKGFGEKTQADVMAKIEFFQKSKGSFLYAQAEKVAPFFHEFLQKIFPDCKITVTGKMARQLETIEALEWVIALEETEILNKISHVDGITFKEKSGDALIFSTEAGIEIILYQATAENYTVLSIQYSSSPEFFEQLPVITTPVTDEVSYFAAAKLPFYPAMCREFPEMVLEKTEIPKNLIQPENIRGLIHCHSTWSDGSHSIEEMAKAAIGQGLEYMAISDHSKSAFYANGLQEERIIAQHKEIESLNKKLSPFRIFKSIESDILNDGSLDYNNGVLESFDLVIASIHSNLNMPEEKAMTRLIKAIENPYCSILGHITGRILLSRSGYPVNHRKIIDACAANQVVIELNANPSRLDIDWRHIGYALDKNVLISINPDAHHVDGIADTRYGVLVAQKAMVTTTQNLSSFTLEAFTSFIEKTKARKTT
ncbi:MAG: helix-hairpin-helix domain-containing protein [Sphingobacteriales bacterium]|nr:helix-hairpin-helix domain-containing protein [Sphingobacteriales bacterium]